MPKTDPREALRALEKQGEDNIWRTAKAAGEEFDRLRAALEEIVNPLAFMERRAKTNGSRLNESAYGICHSVPYLQQIAREALNQKEGQEQ